MELDYNTKEYKDEKYEQRNNALRFNKSAEYRHDYSTL